MNTFTLAAGLSLAFSLHSSTTQHGEHWADFDGDGRRDVVLIGPDGGLHLILNDALLGMQPAPDTWGLQGLGACKDVVVGDADGDGTIDLFLIGRFGNHALLRNRRTSFENVTVRSGLDEVGAIESAEWIDYDRDGRVDLSLRPTGGGLVLYRNLGDGLFGAQQVLAPANTAGSVVVTTTGSEEGEETKAETEESATEGTTRGSMGNRTPLGRTGSGTADLTLTTTTTTSAAAPQLNAVNNCVNSMADFAGGPCIVASSVPLADALLPLGPNFFVNASGDVGLRNESPRADLHVSGGQVSTVRVASPNTGGTGSSTIELALGDTYDEGMELKTTMAGLEINSRRYAQGGIPNTYGPHLFIGRSTTASIGVNEDTPQASFHVNGTARVDGTFSGRRVDNTQTFLVEPSYGGTNGSARVRLDQGDGNLGIVLDAENTVNSGSKLTMYGNNGTLRVELDADDAGAAFMRLYKANNTVGILLDADQNGDARITTEVLEITGGADLVESFDTGDIVCEPGTVVSIDPTRPGELTLSSGPYDRRVAGIVSGAGGVQPGLHMGQTGVASGSTPVALTGRVYVRCSAENGRVEPGDLLTTSSVPGVAMRASDPMRSFGSSIGKAMTGIESGTGLVLVLVNLQ